MQPAQRLCQLAGVPRGDQQHPLPRRPDVVRSALAAAADRRHAGGHRLDEGHAEGFVNPGHHEHVALRQLAQRPLVGQLAGEADAISEAELERQPLEPLALLPVADHQVRRSDLRLEQRHRSQDRGVVLARLQVSDRHERQLLTTARAPAGHLGRPQPGHVGAEVDNRRRQRT